MKSDSVRILLVEDEPQTNRLLQRLIEQEMPHTAKISSTQTLESALNCLSRENVDLILLDLGLPDSSGLQTLINVQQAAPQLPLVILSGVADENIALEAVRHGAQDYLFKGKVDSQTLARAVRYALERKQAEAASNPTIDQNELLVHSLPSVMIGIDKSGQITFWNSVADRVFGIPGKTVLHHNLSECGLTWDVSEVLRRLPECTAKTQPIYLEDIPFQTPTGESGVLGCTLISIQSPEGVSSGYLLFGTNVVDQRLAETNLQQQMDQLQSINQVMMGRERRILELKREVNALLEEGGRPARYKANSQPLD